MSGRRERSGGEGRLWSECKIYKLIMKNKRIAGAFNCWAIFPGLELHFLISVSDNSPSVYCNTTDISCWY